MITVVGVRFRNAGKVYYFDPGELQFSDGDKVIVETVRGLECGDVVGEPRPVPDEEVAQPLKKVIRKATPEDEAVVGENREKEQRAFKIGLEKIAAHGLPMKLVDVEYTFDGSKIIFFFTADGRVDFRELVKDLAGVFRTRIELRQIGVRDEAKMIGGLGPCGRPLCCATFLRDFEPVSIRMAKDQNLSLNPTKISGICGRLMCCLKYEHDVYKDLRQGLPPVGSEIDTEAGRGKITEVDVLKGAATVKMQDGKTVRVDVRRQDGSGRYRAIPANHANGLHRPCGPCCQAEAIPEPDDLTVEQDGDTRPASGDPDGPGEVVTLGDGLVVAARESAAGRDGREGHERTGSREGGREGREGREGRTGRESHAGRESRTDGEGPGGAADGAADGGGAGGNGAGRARTANAKTRNRRRRSRQTHKPERTGGSSGHGAAIEQGASAQTAAAGHSGQGPSRRGLVRPRHAQHQGPRMAGDTRRPDRVAASATSGQSGKPDQSGLSIRSDNPGNPDIPGGPRGSGESSNSTASKRARGASGRRHTRRRRRVSGPRPGSDVSVAPAGARASGSPANDGADRDRRAGSGR